MEETEIIEGEVVEVQVRFFGVDVIDCMYLNVCV